MLVESTMDPGNAQTKICFQRNEEPLLSAEMSKLTAHNDTTAAKVIWERYEQVETA